MTLAFFAYVVMPGLALLVAGAGYAIIVITAPVSTAKPTTVGDRLDHTAP